MAIGANRCQVEYRPVSLQGHYIIDEHCHQMSQCIYTGVEYVQRKSVWLRAYNIHYQKFNTKHVSLFDLITYSVVSI